jgi:uncharacterized integral membrane protein
MHTAAIVDNHKNNMDFNKIIKFKIGKEEWEMPLGVILLLGGISLAMIIGGLFMGFKFGENLQ